MSRTLLSTCFAALTVISLSSGAHAQQSFKTPEEAAAALVTAVRTGEDSAMLTVLGAGGADIISSGDPVDDAEQRMRFVAAYDAKHNVQTNNRTATLIVGTDDFPFPIPMLQKAAGWQFDTEAGRREILNRRIGRNELHAIQAALAYVDAQHDYAEKNDGAYAQRIVSRPGQKDGLYWPTEQGDESPLGELFAKAALGGYRTGSGPVPYHGYYYKVLTRQGRGAPGGAYSYLLRGRMVGGFALVAYPASYRNSGVMTFIVRHDGTVFQKDLGPQTRRAASRMTAFDPNPSWIQVKDTAPPR
jgi:hypothetical protein